MENVVCPSGEGEEEIMSGEASSSLSHTTWALGQADGAGDVVRPSSKQETPTPVLLLFVYFIVKPGTASEEAPEEKREVLRTHTGRWESVAKRQKFQRNFIG
ncbi:hypothetical protein GPALN_012351 [Globodera pallida]|nr:hypothetical protein GPALN_012351 [Globodera pallida]